MEDIWGHILTYLQNYSPCGWERTQDRSAGGEKSQRLQSQIKHEASSVPEEKRHRLSARFLRLWGPALPLSPRFSFHHVLPNHCPSFTPPCTLTKVLHILPGQLQCNLLQGAFSGSRRHNNPFSVFAQSFAFNGHTQPTLPGAYRQIYLSSPICTLMFYILTQTFNS